MRDAFPSIQPDLTEAMFAERATRSLAVLDPGAAVQRDAPGACLRACLQGAAGNIAMLGCAWLRAAAAGETRNDLLQNNRCPRGYRADTVGCSVAGRDVQLVSVGPDGAADEPLEAAGAVEALDSLQSEFNAWSQIRELADENEALADEVLQNYEKLSLLFDLTHRIAHVTHVAEIETLLMSRLAELLHCPRLQILRHDGALQEFHAGEQGYSDRIPHLPEPAAQAANEARQSGSVAVRALDREGCASVNGDAPGQAASASEARPAPVAGAIERWMVGPLRRLDDKIDIVVIGRTSCEADFTSGDMQLMESLLLFGGQILSNNELHQRLRQMSIETTRALVAAIDKKDHYTFGHSERVSFLARLTGQEMGIASHELELLEWAGLLHDVGKIGVPEEILCKPGRLTDEEFAHIKRHPEMGYEILEPISHFQHILDGVLYHHENPNGTGYPRGLRGDQIPLSAAIIHVVDVFDALTSRRSYRDAFSTEAALDIIRREAAEEKLDAHAVDAFLRAIERFRREQTAAFAVMFPGQAEGDRD